MRRNPANGAKMPKIFRRYAPGDSPPDFSTHIQYVSTALFSSLGCDGFTCDPEICILSPDRGFFRKGSMYFVSENRENWLSWRISSSASVTRPPSYAWQPPQSVLVPRWRKPSSVHDDNAGVASLIGRCTFRHPMKLHRGPGSAMAPRRWGYTCPVRSNSIAQRRGGHARQRMRPRNRPARVVDEGATLLSHGPPARARTEASGGDHGEERHVLRGLGSAG